MAQFILPEPASRIPSPQNLNLLSQVLIHIFDAAIPHADRNLLRALALLAPNPSVLRSLLGIVDPRQLMVLARLTYAGFIAFRNRGGRPSGTPLGTSHPSTPRGTTEQSSPASTPPSTPAPGPVSASRRAQAPSPGPLPIIAQPSPPPVAPPGNSTWPAASDPAIQLPALCAAFGFSPLRLKPSLSAASPVLPSQPPSSIARYGRPAYFHSNLLLRNPSDATCALTGYPGPHTLKAAHILPNSFVNGTATSQTSAPVEHTALWLFLTFFLGPNLRDQLWSYLVDGKGHSTYNGLLLDTRLHDLFDAGMITLIPFEEPLPVQPDILLVRFTYHDINTMLCFTPTSRRNAFTGEEGFRPLKDGDVFSIETVDGERWPVPMKGFLMLHHLLWVGLGMVGLVREAGNPGGERKEVDREKRREPGIKRQRTNPPKQSPNTQAKVTPSSPGDTNLIADSRSPQDQQDGILHRLQQPRSVSGSSSSSSESIFDHPTRQPIVASSVLASTSMPQKRSSVYELTPSPPGSPPQGTGNEDIPKLRLVKRTNALDATGANPTPCVTSVEMQQKQDFTYPQAVVINHGQRGSLDESIDTKLYRVIDDLRQHWPVQNSYQNTYQHGAYSNAGGCCADDTDPYSSNEDYGGGGYSGDGYESGDGIVDDHLDTGTCWYERFPDLMRELEWARGIWAAE
ncbi:hypothetical protein EV426DRAFT_645711 [Tirmania nivea]|nr:hypothetical protein EV426DRAFT_645711 [Tirmania nivea]